MTTRIAFTRVGQPARHYLGWLMPLLCIASPISTRPLLAQESIPPGTVDSTFQSHIRRGAVEAVLVQPDGRLLVGGTEGTNLMSLSRDGARDPTFTPTAGVPRKVTKLALQPDGKVLVGNKGGVDGEYPWIGFSRFLPDGTKDQSFRFRMPTNQISSGIWSGFWTTALAVEPDGKILLAGYYERDHFDYWYWSAATLQRRPLDGSEGQFVQIPWPSPQYIGVLVLLPDQRLLVAGDQLLRLNADGTEDAGFARTVLPNYGFAARAGIECCITQPDGKILIGGNFTNIQGHVRWRIARLMVDGRLDLSFNPPVNTVDDFPYYMAVRALALQSDGRILVGGDFQTMDGLPYVALARLHSDGSLDTTFPPILPLDEDQDTVSVRAIVIQDETRALIGGERMLLPGASGPAGLFRVHLGEPSPRLLIQRAPEGTVQLTCSYTGNREFTVLTTTNLALPMSNWTELGSATNVGGGFYQFTDRLSQSQTHRFYRLKFLSDLTAKP